MCRKQFHAIHLQAVCNMKSIFTHCYAGHAGSVHDARVFRNSALAHYIEVPNEYFPFDTHIIADAAYAIHPHVIHLEIMAISQYLKKLQFLFVLN